MTIRSYSPVAYTDVLLRSGYSAPVGFSVNVELDGWAADFSGHGYLAGTFPDGITSVEGVPGSAEIRILHRAEEVSPVDGALVAVIQSAPDGTWLIQNLNPDLKYDVICRHAGYNDMILSNVSPVLPEGIEFAGEFVTLDDQVQILFGTAPYQVAVVEGAAPAGVTFGAVGDFLVAVGEPTEVGDYYFAIRVIDAGGVSGVLHCALNIEKWWDDHWDKVVSLLYFEGGEARDHRGNSWALTSAVIDEDVMITSGGDISSSDSVLRTIGNDSVTVEMFAEVTAGNQAALFSFHNARSSPGRVLGVHITDEIEDDYRLQFAGASGSGGSAVWWGGSEVRATFGAIKHVSICISEVVGSSRLCEIFVEGRKVSSVQANRTSLNCSAVSFGYAYWTANRRFSGKLKSVRITKGVVRHTENFTPPTEPFPSVGPP